MKSPNRTGHNASGMLKYSKAEHQPSKAMQAMANRTSGSYEKATISDKDNEITAIHV